MIRVYLLGPLAIEGPGGEARLPTAKTQLLAAYLFWRQGTWTRREELRGMLWGESEEERAAANLRMALHFLRKALAGACPNQILEVRRDALRVCPDCECRVDVRAFEENAWKGLREGAESLDSLAIAASLYRGDFLEGFDTEWCRAERLRLADLHVGVQRALVQHLTAVGLYEAAVSRARQCLAADPLDEKAHQALMRLYHLMGQRARVAQQFAECGRILKADLAAPPSQETIDLYRELTAASSETGPEAAPTETSKLSDQTVSRTAELQLSKDPLRNARLLLAYAESKALLGDVAAAHSAAKTALETYARLGSEAEQAKAALLGAKVLLTWCSRPLAAQALLAVEPALAYYRPRHPSAELVRSSCLAAAASHVLGDTEKAAALATEGLKVARALGDNEGRALLTLLLAIAYCDEYRLARSAALFDQVAEAVHHFGDVQDILRYLVHHAVLFKRTGNFPAAERLLGEALAVARTMDDSTPHARLTEWLARLELLIIGHYRGKRGAKENVSAPPDVDRVMPETLTYLICLFAPGTSERREVVAAVGRLLRTRISVSSANNLLPTISILVERMLAVGLEPAPLAWTAAGACLARRESWHGWEAVFYARRAVVLARAGRLAAAKASTRRAWQTIDAGDRLTPAWLAWAEGLIHLALGDRAAAEQPLVRGQQLFKKMGDHYDSSQVARDLARCRGRETQTRRHLTPAPSPPTNLIP